MQYKLMNEYGVDWPLWTDDRLCDPGQPDLPPRTVSAVHAWAEQFNAQYSPDRGWPDSTIAGEHEAQALRLETIISNTLPDGDIVTLQYWETAHR